MPRYLPRILRSGPRDELVIIPATLVGSATTTHLGERPDETIVPTVARCLRG